MLNLFLWPHLTGLLFLTWASIFLMFNADVLISCCGKPSLFFWLKLKVRNTAFISNLEDAFGAIVDPMKMLPSWVSEHIPHVGLANRINPHWCRRWMFRKKCKGFSMLPARSRSPIVCLHLASLQSERLGRGLATTVFSLNSRRRMCCSLKCLRLQG